MSASKKIRELQRATMEHNKRKLSADIACSNHAMLDMAEAIIAKDNESLRQQLAEARKDAASKQAKIDSLMLEYCPDEMTAEQLDEWAKHQKPYEGDKP